MSGSPGTQLDATAAILEQGLPLDAAQLGTIQQTKEKQAQAGKGLEYDPETYQATWTHMLRHRPVEVHNMDMMLDTEGMSAYDYDCELHSIAPSLDDVSKYFARVVKQYSSLDSSEEINKLLNQQADAWTIT